MNYATIVRVADKALLATPLSLFRVAIPSLHIIRPHPEFHKEFSNLRPLGYACLLLKIITSALKALSSTIRLCIKQIKKSNHELTKVDNEIISIIFLSHYHNVNDLSSSIDQYFGDIIAQLAEKNYRVIRLVINHTGFHSYESIHVAPKQSFCTLTEPCALNFSEEFRIYFEALVELVRYGGLLKLFPKRNERKIYRLLFENSFANAIRIRRISKWVGSHARRVGAKHLITTYEGHAFERAIFGEVRRTNSKINCVGYAHSAIFKCQHAIGRSLGKEFDPDIIFTSGRESSRLLRQQANYTHTKIITLGSQKYFRVMRRSSAENCLVLSEGYDSEEKFLLDFTVECAKLNNTINFIFRKHPSKSTSNSDKLIKLPSNIVISRKSLAEDISESKYAIFRGSASIIMACCNGLYPIYVNDSTAIDISPIHTIANLYTRVNSPFLFGELDEKSRLVDIQTYCSNLFTPFDYAKLLRFL